MRTTPFKDEILITFEEGALRAVPRPRASALHHLGLSGAVAAGPVLQGLRLQDALITAGTGAVRTAQGDWLATCAPDPQPPETAPTAQLKTAISGCSTRGQGWLTFLTEVLPRILFSAQAAPPGTPIVIEDDLASTQRQALALALPDNPLHPLRRGQSLAVEQLFVTIGGTVQGLSASPMAADALSILPERAGPAPEGAARVLLWSARVPERLRNAADLRARLEARGFVTVDRDALSLAARIHALGGAEAVVAPDEDSFADALLTRAGAQIFPLVPLGTDLLPLSMLADRRGLRLTAVVGSAPYRRLRSRLLPWARRVFHVAPHLLTPFFPVPDEDLTGLSTWACLDHLHAAATEADVLTGAWAVAAEATPAGFEDRQRQLRLFAARGIAGAEGAALKDLLAHPFIADFSRNLRSGYPVLGKFTDWEQEVAVQVLSALSGEAAPGPLAGEALEGEAGARRLTLLTMLLLPCWTVPMPEAPAALPEDVAERRIAFAATPPALIHAGEDALWVAHVERLLHWLADRLAPESDLPPALHLRLHRMAGRLDLGQLLLIDHPLRGVQAARNRVLDRVALGGSVRQEASRPVGRLGRLRERLAFYAERIRLARAASPHGPIRFLLALAYHRGRGMLRNRLRRPAPVEVIRDAPRDGRIRIGILCRTFEKGPDSEAVLAFCRGFDPAKYQLFAYSIGFRDRVVSRDPAFDRLFDATFPQRRDLPTDPAGVRARLLADGLDVFLYANATTYGLQPLDLALFRRVAPLQLVLNSHVPMPMGYPSFDGVITGTSDDPAHEVPQLEFAETLIRLPGPVINYLTTLEPKPNPPLDRAALGLRSTDVVMMNAGSSMKLRAPCLRAMMQAVAGVPDGVLLLAPYNPGWAARSMAFVFNRQLAETAEEVGLDPARIQVLGELSVAEAEAALSCADLYLNPFPHGGATMTHLALIHGVPPVTLRRRSTRSIDQFLVESHGFGELLADTSEGYVALAQTLARDPARRADLVARLREAAKTPGFVNNADYAEEMQRAVGAAWAAHAAGRGAP